VIFVDTTFWVGAADGNDELHESSHPVVDAIRLGRLPIALTTDYVIDETVTVLGRRRGFGADKAGKVGESILSSPRVIVCFIEDTILRTALKTYPKYNGQLSLTDVSSITVMEKYKVKEIFSHDSDFDKVHGVIRREKP